MPQRFCERCERTTQNGHLWCPYTDCPAETGFPVFEYGDWLGDLKITKLIRCWRWAALYEADRLGKPVWLKVAHNNPEAQDRLKREAKLLETLKPKIQSDSPMRAAPRPLWPSLMEPVPGSGKRAYGEITFLGEPKVFYVTNAIGGSILSDMLLENPQIWHYEAAWITSTLAEAMRPLVSNNLAHLNLSPDVVTINKDEEGHWRPTLLDFGWLVDGKTTSAGMTDILAQLEPAYTAPEVQTGSRLSTVSPAADTYSLGMMLHEMLAGTPGYEPHLKRDEQVRKVVVATKAAVSTERPELDSAGVVKIVERAIGPRDRQANVSELGNELTKIYGAPPPEKRSLPAKSKAILTLGAVILGIVAIFALVTLLRALGAR